MGMKLNLNDWVEEYQPQSVTVVSLHTSYLFTERGITQTKRLRTLKRKSTGYDLLNEEIALEAENLMPKIINLNDVPDGKYTLTVTNISRDWETNQVEDWDYELVEVEKDG